MSHNSQNESYSGPPPARPTDQESPPPDFHPAAAEDTTIPTAEQLIGLTPAGLRADPDKWPDPARPPNIRRAVNHVEILNGERGVSFPRSCFSYWWNGPLTTALSHLSDRGSHHERGQD